MATPSPELPTPSAQDLRRGLAYFNGQLGTSPLPEPVRLSAHDDAPNVLTSAPDDQRRWAVLALETLREGRGVYATLAAGASSRMNPADAPADIQPLIARLYGAGATLRSKAAVPIGSWNGTVYTFLGLFLKNLARLEQLANGTAAPGSRQNQALIFTNDEYEGELMRELEAQRRYGFEGPIVTPHQPLGAQYIAHRPDFERVAGKLTSERRIEALARLERVEADVTQGRTASVVVAEEPAPLGHGEFLHEIVRSGLLLDWFERGVRWVSVRNIDNVAATFDWGWLVTLGRFLEDGADLQMEVSPRLPDQKGGALAVTSSGERWIVEDPVVEATWLAVLEEARREGYVLASSDEAAALARQVLKRQGSIDVQPHRLELASERYKDERAIVSRIRAGGLAAVRREDGHVRWFRRPGSTEAFWFNNATALFRPEYLFYIYRAEAQSLEDFRRELRQASGTPGGLDRIAERGRERFPVVIDPKPARTIAAVVVKLETNLWQSAVVAKGAKVTAVGVESASAIDRAGFSTLSPSARARVLAHVRMLATKQWDGPAESFESNRLFLDDLAKRVLSGDLLNPADI